MVHHIVLFTFYPDTSEKQIDDLAKALVELTRAVPGVTRYVWGPSISTEHLEKGYTHGFIMTFKDVATRDSYLPHPAHAELVKKYVDPICDKGISFDINE